MAVFVDKYRDEIPTIGKVLAHIPGPPKKVELEWWHGKYSSIWSVCKRRREGRKVVVWTETLLADSILMEVKLTKTNRLSKQTVNSLKLIVA